MRVLAAAAPFGVAAVLGIAGGVGAANLAPQTSTPTARATAPALRISARQREVVRAAAAPYRGSTVRILVLQSGASGYTAFAQGFAAALEAAGIEVVAETVDTLDLPDCPHVPGIRVRYGASRSGAVHAIAESLIRARVVTESVSGCSVQQEDEFTFILSPAAS